MKKLKKMLIERNMKIYELADLTGVTYKQVSRIANGHSDGSLKWWRKAAKVLRCDLTDIIE